VLVEPMTIEAAVARHFAVVSRGSAGAGAVSVGQGSIPMAAQASCITG
jgi:hypothetical protein